MGMAYPHGGFRVLDGGLRTRSMETAFQRRQPAQTSEELAGALELGEVLSAPIPIDSAPLRHLRGQREEGIFTEAHDSALANSSKDREADMRAASAEGMPISSAISGKVMSSSIRWITACRCRSGSEARPIS